MEKINYFEDHNFFDSAEKLFKDLNIPLKSVDNKPFRPEEFLANTYNPNSPSHSSVDKAYLLGIVDDDAFTHKSQYDSLEKIAAITSDYEGLAVVGIELKPRENNLLPTRSQLAEITRAVNREFLYTPVTVLFKYGEYLALANAERTSFLVKYKEGEKVGKVSLLRDVNYLHPHTGHLQILRDLRRPDKVRTFTELYKHWGDIFSVNVLNKKFYQELSNWYFWAIQNVTFPGQPTLDDAHLQGKDFKDLKQQHNATNVIRMLTRLLFVWFMKEKKLIPDELFELEDLQNDILNEIQPFHENGLYSEINKDSVYYKAILQNLFFATLNCPIKSDSLDKRARAFRGDGYGTNRGIDWLMRYKKYFKNPQNFVELVNKTTPFLNGGLFECLDDKDQNIYIDGFSDQMTKGEQLVVPDYLFFGLEEETDLSDVIGIADKKTKNSAVKGLINILKSYKFTITENTPIEEEVALDPELLGKVFENLLASYNPETKTTARKQTGSFYTPREIVNYMVDESLIAYLKNKIQSDESDEELDRQLHQLVTYNSENPFANDPKKTRAILKYLDECTILDPACGSGAFPMGVLQKMVHILDKLDPDNKIWKEVQIDKAKKESDDAFAIEDKQAREDRLIEINEAFDQNINNPDYARKLFLIENCIYGVDIQPIATQISKLRFFISLVVEQKVDQSKDNFGIRPLPNLETKFVAANTLIGIEKETNLFSIDEIKILEQKLKLVRNKLFGAKSKETKLKYRELDKQLRLQIADKLKENGLPVASAEKLASWDPFDQNASSSFFDPEWMFDIKEGFDIVIGNPPYVGHKGGMKEMFRSLKQTTLGKKFNNERMDLFYYFFHQSINFANTKGTITFITTNYYLTADSAFKLRRDFYERTKLIKLVNFNELKVFESAMGQHNIITFLSKNFANNDCSIININKKGFADSQSVNNILYNTDSEDVSYYIQNNDEMYDGEKYYIRLQNATGDSYRMQNDNILNKVKSENEVLGNYCNISQGIVTGIDKIGPKHILRQKEFAKNRNDGVFVISDEEKVQIGESELLKPWFKNSDIKRFYVSEKPTKWLIHTSVNIKIREYPNIEKHLNYFKKLILSRNYESGELSKAKRLDRWWSLSSSRWEFNFDEPKIVSPQRSYFNTFGFTNKSWYASADVYFISSKEDGLNLKYILGILNSKLIFFWLYNRGKRKGEMLELYLTPLSEIPIKKPSLSQDIKIIQLVNKIIDLKNENPDAHTENFEKDLDILVYKIYELTYEEIEVVDPEIDLTKEEYDAVIF